MIHTTKALSEKVILITGSTDGLGKSVATTLAAKGAAVILHGRDQTKGEELASGLIRQTGNSKIVFYHADLSDLVQVRSLADTILSSHRQLDVLINNAGIGPGPKNGKRELTAEGYELRFTVNYLSHFLLIHLLFPLLRGTPRSRIVMIASGMQRALDFDDLMLERDYSGSRAYAQSKLAIIMLGMTLAEKLADDRIVVNSVHPASLMDTWLVRESSSKPRSTVAEGTDAVVHVACAAETADITGAFFDGRQESYADAQAYDSDARELLYHTSLRITRL